MSVIGIRVDGNNIVGTGHVMRCLAIADELVNEGNQVIFIMADDSAKSKIDLSRYGYVSLNSTWNDMESEIKELKIEITSLSVSLLLIDSYYVTDKYLKELRKVVKTVYIDDVYAFDYSVDMLINYSAYADITKYKNSDTKYLIGTSYAPLRKQFRLQKKDIDNPNKKILILSGGTDPYDVISTLPNLLLNEKELALYSFVVIKGAFLDHVTSLDDSRIIVCENVANMAGLMSGIDFAVSAGGVTLYELCACQIPTVTYSFVDNQLGNVHAFDDLNLMPYAGDLRDDKEKVFNQIVAKLKLLVNETNDDLKLRMKQYVDGFGTKRIASEIKNLIDT